MNTYLKKDKTIEKLIKTIEKLEIDFSEKLLNKKHLENELYIFKLEYDSKIAPIYLEKLGIDKQINEILISRGIPLDRFKIDNKYQPEIVDQELFEGQKEYFETKNIEKEKIEENIENMGEVSFDDFKKLYKKLAMKFHPDRFTSQPKKQEKALALMKEINQAFQERDLDKLQKMEAQGFDLEIDENKLDENELLVKINNLENNIESLVVEITQIGESGLYILYKTYLKYGKKEFYIKIINETKQDIKEASEILKVLQEMKT